MGVTITGDGGVANAADRRLKHEGHEGHEGPRIQELTRRRIATNIHKLTQIDCLNNKLSRAGQRFGSREKHL